MDKVRATTERAARRAAAVLLLAFGLVVASAIPSGASFTAYTATPRMSLSTVTVSPPGDLAPSVSCKGNTVTVRLDWAASPTSRVSGYLVRLYLNNAWQDQATLGPTATFWSGSAGSFYTTAYVMTFTVTTLTEYGWTAESPRTARITC